MSTKPEHYDVIVDAQGLMKYIRAEVALFRLRNGKRINVEAAATLTSNIFDASSISRRKIDIVVPEVDAEEVVDCIKKAATTGVAGDGKIFVKDVRTSVRISI